MTNKAIIDFANNGLKRVEHAKVCMRNYILYEPEECEAVKMFAETAIKCLEFLDKEKYNNAIYAAKVLHCTTYWSNREMVIKDKMAKELFESSIEAINILVAEYEDIKREKKKGHI